MSPTDTDAKDHLERLKLMVEDSGQTWDLSENDRKAIAWALGKIAAAARTQAPSEQSVREFLDAYVIEHHGSVAVLFGHGVVCDILKAYAESLAGTQAQAAQLKLDEHLEHVQRFLNDLWAYSIDPLHEGMQGLKVAEVCTALLKAAQTNRDSVYELDGLFRTACLWVWKGIDAPGQTLESTMEAMRQEYAKTLPVAPVAALERKP